MNERIFPTYFRCCTNLYCPTGCENDQTCSEQPCILGFVIRYEMSLRESHKNASKSKKEDLHDLIPDKNFSCTYNATKPGWGQQIWIHISVSINTRLLTNFPRLEREIDFPPPPPSNSSLPFNFCPSLALHLLFLSPIPPISGASRPDLRYLSRRSKNSNIRVKRK